MQDLVVLADASFAVRVVHHLLPIFVSAYKINDSTNMAMSSMMYYEK